MKITAVILGTLAISYLIFLALNSKPYTSEEWNDQLEKDFEKYGPVPDDIDNDDVP